MKDPIRSTDRVDYWENFVSSLISNPDQRSFDAVTYFYNANCGTELLETLDKHTFYGVEARDVTACGFYLLDFT